MTSFLVGFTLLLTIRVGVPRQPPTISNTSCAGTTRTVRRVLALHRLAKVQMDPSRREKLTPHWLLASTQCGSQVNPPAIERLNTVTPDLDPGPLHLVPCRISNLGSQPTLSRVSAW